jgi:hypothetical protein
MTDRIWGNYSNATNSEINYKNGTNSEVNYKNGATLRHSPRWHGTGTIFVIYLQIGTIWVNSPKNLYWFSQCRKIIWKSNASKEVYDTVQSRQFQFLFLKICDRAPVVHVHGYCLVSGTSSAHTKECLERQNPSCTPSLKLVCRWLRCQAVQRV